MSALRTLLVLASVLSLAGCDIILGIDGPIEDLVANSSTAGAGGGSGGAAAGGSGGGGPCAFPAGGLLSWQQAYGDFDVQGATAVAAGPSCEIVVAGTFANTLHPTALSNDGEPDMFVLELDAVGNLVWSLQLGGTSPSGRINAVAVGDDGEITLAGVLHGPVDFGDGDEIGPMGLDEDAFVARYAADKSLRWKRRIGDAGDDFATAVALDAEGNVVVVGTSFEPQDLLGETLIPNGLLDAFVLVLEGEDGEVRWVQLFGGAQDDYGTSAAVHDDGTVLAAVEFWDVVSFGNPAAPTHTAESSDVAFLARDAADGSFDDELIVSGVGYHRSGQIAVAPGIDNIAVGLTMVSAYLDFAGQEYHAGSSPHVFVAWLNRDLNPVPMVPGKLFGDPRSSYGLPFAMGVAPQGRLMIAGAVITEGGILNLGGADLTIELGTPFFAAYDAELEHLQSAVWEGAASPAVGLAVDPSGALVTVGTFNDTLLDLMSAGGTDAFIARRESMIP